MAQRQEIPSTKLIVIITILFIGMSALIFLNHHSHLFLIPKLLLISIVLYYVFAEFLLEKQSHTKLYVKFLISWGALFVLFIFYSLVMNYLLDIPNAFYQSVGIAPRGTLFALILLPAGFILSRIIHLKVYPLYKHEHDKYHQLLYYMFLYPFGAFLLYFLYTYGYVVYILSTK